MKLREFLRRKNIYRRFKHNFNEQRLHGSMSFHEYLGIWHDDPVAIRHAFNWGECLNESADFWAMIDQQWRDHLLDAEDYGKENIS